MKFCADIITVKLHFLSGQMMSRKHTAFIVKDRFNVDKDFMIQHYQNTVS